MTMSLTMLETQWKQAYEVIRDIIATIERESRL